MTADAWRAEIDRRLNEARPARYHEDDTAWMQPVVEWAVEHLPVEVRAQAAWGALIDRWTGGRLLMTTTNGDATD